MMDQFEVHELYLLDIFFFFYVVVLLKYYHSHYYVLPHYHFFVVFYLSDILLFRFNLQSQIENTNKPLFYLDFDYLSFQSF